MYRLLVTDLDDTLLRDDLTISPRTRDTLLRAEAEGVRIVLASGRPTGAILPFAETLELERCGGFIISFNGAVVTDCRSGKVLRQQALPRERLQELYDIAVAHGAGILGYHDGCIITPQKNEWTAVESRLTGLPVRETPDFREIIDASSIKAIMVGEPAQLAALADELRPELGGRVNMALSKPFFLEFTGQDINKKQSLAFLCERLNIPAAEVVACGDSFNDMGMLEFAGLAVCVRNGRDEVKTIADHVTFSNMEDGVARAVEKFMLRK